MHKFDEMYAQLPFVDSAVRPHYRNYLDWLKRQDPQTMRDRREEAEMIFRRVGITFAVYGDKDEDGAGTERLIPFDLIPRIIPAHEWTSMQQGLVQRVNALNMFIHDVYHEQGILKAGIIPSEQILNNAQYRPEMHGVDVPHKVYSQISGIDIVRAPDAQGNGDDDATLSRVVQPTPRSPRGALPRLVTRNFACQQPIHHRQPHRGGADARHVQQRVL
jgi:uncharacterized circularly permuted ATP-grasp superfamily protein